MRSRNHSSSTPSRWRLLICGAVTLAAVAYIVGRIEWRDVAVVGSERLVGAGIESGDGVISFQSDDGRRFEISNSSEGVYLPGMKSLMRRINLPLVAVGLIMLMIPLVLLAIRWQLLLQLHGIEQGFLELLRLSWLSSFANNLLPGTSGTDLALILCICRRAPERRADAASTVLVARFLGFAALLTIGIVAALLQNGRPDLAGVTRVAVMCLVAMLTCGAALLSRRLRRLFRTDKMLAAIPFGDRLQRLDDSILQYRDSLGTLALCFVLSILMQGSVVFGILVLSRSLALSPPPLAVFVAVPFAILVGAVSPSINGVGVREAAFQFLFAGILSSSGAVALSLLFRIVELLASLPGALPLYYELKTRPSEDPPQLRIIRIDDVRVKDHLARAA